MAHEDYKIPKLNGDNYHAWSIRARAALVQKRCWEAIEPGFGAEMTNDQRRRNEEALTLLFLIVEDTFLDDIGECLRAIDAWNILKRLHTQYGLLHILQFMREFFNVSMRPGESIKDYLGRLMEIHRKLTNGGYAFTDREVALVMLMGLPKAYEPLILNLEKDEDNLTTTIVKARLTVEEKRLSRKADVTTEIPEERALATKNSKAPNKYPKKWVPNKTWNNLEAPGAAKAGRTTRCFSCGEWGHISKFCEEAKKRKQNTAKTVINEETHHALSVNDPRSDSSNLWILDSGATEHMSSYRDKFANLKPVSSKVEVANSEKIEVVGIGDILLFPDEECGTGKITLENVLYVPGLGGNLLSVGRIEQKGYTVNFKEGRAVILKDKSEEPILTAHRCGRLYRVEEKSETTYMTRSVNEGLWHRRLGHLHMEAVKKINLNCNLFNSKEDDSAEVQNNELCTTCVLGKMKKSKFPTKEAERASKPLEIIHSDVVGPITPVSKGGSNYLVTFVDDYSRYTVVRPMKSKNQVLEKFDEYRRKVENLHGTKIKTLRSDNGGEYKSQLFDDYLKKHGISHQLTVPGTPQQNGVAERANQTLFDMTRCLLIESGVPSYLWADAVSTACYLRNKCPSAALNGNVPEHVWTGKKSNIDNLRVFGCRALSRLNDTQIKGKLAPRAEECVMIGYVEGVKGYKLWNVEKDKFFVSRNVRFEEAVFPFKGKVLGSDTQLKEDFTLRVYGRDFPDETHDTDSSDRNILTSHEQDDTDDGPIQDDKVIGKEADETEEEIDEIIHQSPSQTVTNAIGHVRTSNRARRPAQYLEDYVLYNVKEDTKCGATSSALDKDDPTSLKEAMESPDAERWKEAIDEELSNLKENNTWELVTKPPNTKVIGSRWLFRRKYDEKGNVSKYKARLVAKGYSQVPGVDCTDTFSPVIKVKSIRILLALAVEMDYELHQMDITAAYLNGTLSEDVYMTQPEGIAEEGREHLVCHLKRSLYGLRQSGLEWNKCLDEFLRQIGLKRSIADPCIYYDNERDVIVGVYVDDLLILGKKKAKIKAFKEKIKKRFKAKDLGEARHILSMRITRKPDGLLTLDQSSYAEEVLNTFGMQNAKGASTPLDPGMKYRLPTGPDTEVVNVPYRQAVGSLLYLACGTRPDLAYSSTYMSQFNEHHSDEHWRGIKHMLRYLKETKDLQLIFKKTGEKLKIFSDADWGGDRVDRKSFSGYVMVLAGAAISWCSKKQNCTALSSSEAEYIAMCQTAKEFLWIRSLLTELQMTFFMDEPQHIFADNQGAMCIAKNHVTSDRSKHIDLRYFFLRDLVASGAVTFAYTPSKNNVADILTKSVPKQILCGLKSEMGLLTVC